MFIKKEINDVKKVYCTRAKYDFQGHSASVTTVANDDEDENVDVEGDTETTMYDIVYGGGNGVWTSGQQQLNRMRQQPMILHAGYNRSE